MPHGPEDMRTHAAQMASTRSLRRANQASRPPRKSHNDHGRQKEKINSCPFVCARVLCTGTLAARASMAVRAAIVMAHESGLFVEESQG
jgi:hypothetical protein